MTSDEARPPMMLRDRPEVRIPPRRALTKYRDRLDALVGLPGYDYLRLTKAERRAYDAERDLDPHDESGRYAALARQLDLVVSDHRRLLDDLGASPSVR